ncbi:alanine/glycine:cation symporter family protein [Intestinibacter sp.]|uniref:alanine/glycine:cation symporter family protein n=1 Tax=Intestinibacter sp. TaxID=1965304 RepID=UPI002F3F5E09
MVGLLFGGQSSDKGISSFQGFCTALAGRIGTGNIAGVATAIAWGGPGALFWMWAIAFLGAGSAFAESTLGQLYKEEHDGEYRGGPAYYIEKGFGGTTFSKIYATLFAIVTVIAIGVLLPGVQSNSIAVSINNAFGAEASFGGILGSTIAWGVKRGVYSNEAGQGTGPQASSAAEVSHPAKQGFVQAFSVYVDTLFVCSATGFMILMTGCYNTFNENTQKIMVENMPGYSIPDIGPVYTQNAINTLIPGFGGAFVAIALFFFAFTTLMAYYYIAEVNLTYLVKKFTGGKSSKLSINCLRIVLLGMTAFGCVKSAGLAWMMGDIGVAMMAWLNLIAILALSKKALLCFNDYESQLKAGVPRDEISFDPIKLGIKGADFWEQKHNTAK